jgi:plastocyanin
MQGIKFSPSTITAKVGQTITWTNMDNVDHNVSATGAQTFNSSNFGQGGTYSMKLTKPGTINYVCTIHEMEGMTGTITVAS